MHLGPMRGAHRDRQLANGSTFDSDAFYMRKCEIIGRAVQLAKESGQDALDWREFLTDSDALVLEEYRQIMEEQ